MGAKILVGALSILIAPAVTLVHGGMENPAKSEGKHKALRPWFRLAALLAVMVAMLGKIAYADSLDPVRCSVMVSSGFSAPIESTDCTSTSFTTMSVNPPAITPGQGFATAQATLFPPSVSATARASGDSQAGGSAQLTVFFEVVGPAAINGIPITSIPIILTVSGGTSAGSCVGECESASGLAKFDLEQAGVGLAQFCASTNSGFTGSVEFGAECGALAPTSSGTFAITQSLLIDANVEGGFTMNAGAGIRGPVLGTAIVEATASVDPIISIAPSFFFADDYQIEFSPGLAPVPEPSSILLLSTAVGVMSMFSRRTRRII